MLAFTSIAREVLPSLSLVNFVKLYICMIQVFFYKYTFTKHRFARTKKRSRG